MFRPVYTRRLDGTTLAERCTNLGCCSLEYLAGRELRVRRTKAKLEPVALAPGEDVQMYVGNFLPGDFTVGEKKVNPFASKTAATQRCRDALSDLHEFAHRGGIERVEVGNVTSRHDQDVPRIDGLDIHESCTRPPSVHECSSHLTKEDLTEDALHRLTSDRSRRAAQAAW
jgi:hypothetical protein